VPSGSISPERLRQVLERIRSGEYDRPEVIRVVAERIASSVLES
jgi:hypothetical protein